MSSKNDSWDERRKAQEEEFFKKQNTAALERIQKRQDEEKPRLSPITGKPMIQKTYMGVVIDKCEESRGIWLDCGELEEIIKLAQETQDSDVNWLSKFFTDIFQSD